MPSNGLPIDKKRKKMPIAVKTEQIKIKKFPAFIISWRLESLAREEIIIESRGISTCLLMPKTGGNISLKVFS